MYKIINLGTEQLYAGEKRVTILNEAMIKTAENDIQKFWSLLSKDPNKAYLHVIAMSAGEYFGSNRNGDYFKEEDLKKYHTSFVEDANVFKHHINKDPNQSYGKVIYSYYNDKMHRVELILEIDKDKSPEIVDKIKKGEDVFVSMGCRVKFDICSICGNRASTRQQYCEHLRYNMNKILPDGRKVYAINPPPLKFFDISIVHKPADPTAWALNKAASVQGYSQSEDYDYTPSSAELGEEYELMQEKIAGISKLGDIIKAIEGDITTAKDTQGEYDNLKNIKKYRHLDYPTLTDDDFEELFNSGVTPGELMTSFLIEGGLPSLSEMAAISGRHMLGKDFKCGIHKPLIMGALPDAVDILKQHPHLIDTLVSSVFSHIGEDYPKKFKVISIKVKPVIRKRIALISGVVPKEGLEKNALEAYKGGQSLVGRIGPISTPVQFKDEGKTNASIRYLQNILGRNFSVTSDPLHDMIVVEDKTTGKKYYTTTNEILMAQEQNDTGKLIKKLGASALILAALGGLVSSDSLATKLLTTVPAGLLGLRLLSNSNSESNIPGTSIPTNTVFREIKEASDSSEDVDYLLNKVASAKKMWQNSETLATALGMSLPAATGIDYFVNTKIKNRNNPYYEESLTGVRKGLHNVGKFVADNPITSIVGGGIAASAMHNALPLLLKRTRAIKK